MYRCPYCGEPAFSLQVKLGLGSKFDTHPRCPHCKKICSRDAAFGGKWAYHSWLLLLALLLCVSCFALAVMFQWDVLYLVGVALIFAAYIAYNYLFSHFDKTSARDRAQDPRFLFHAEPVGRIWPTVREGEIYILQFPREGMRADKSPRVIGMIEAITKAPQGLTFRIRVIKAEELTEIPAETDVRLVTDGMLVISGVTGSDTVGLR